MNPFISKIDPGNGTNGEEGNRRGSGRRLSTQEAMQVRQNNNKKDKQKNKTKKQKKINSNKKT